MATRTISLHCDAAVRDIVTAALREYAHAACPGRWSRVRDLKSFATESTEEHGNINTEIIQKTHHLPVTSQYVIAVFVFLQLLAFDVNFSVFFRGFRG